MFSVKNHRMLDLARVFTFISLLFSSCQSTDTIWWEKEEEEEDRLILTNLKISLTFTFIHSQTSIHNHHKILTQFQVNFKTIHFFLTPPIVVMIDCCFINWSYLWFAHTTTMINIRSSILFRLSSITYVMNMTNVSNYSLTCFLFDVSSHARMIYYVIFFLFT